MENPNINILNVTRDIVEHIFSYLGPPDLQSVALTHSYFYFCSERLRFRSISLTVAGRRPVLLARTLLERPQFQQHVRHLALDQPPAMNHLVPNMLASPHPILSVFDIFPFNFLDQVILERHLEEKGLGRIASAFRQPGYNQPELLALLFSLMPNVAGLKIHAELFHDAFFQGRGAPGCVNIEDCVDCHWGDDTSDLTASRPLQNLKVFVLDEGKLLGRCWTEPWAVEDYPDKLHHVPGMLNTVGLRRYAGILPDAFLKILLSNHDGPFNFTHLSVKMTMSDPSLLRKFLARTPHLTVLEYRHYWVNDRSTFNFDGLYHALLKVKCTLSSLHITTDSYHEAQHSDLMDLRLRVPTFDDLLADNFGSLHEFSNLKTLMLPGPMLLAVRDAMHSPLSPDGFPIPLLDALPPSLEHLAVTDCLLPLLPPQTSSPSDFHVIHRSVLKFAWTIQTLRMSKKECMSALKTLAVHTKTHWLRWPQREVMSLVRNVGALGVEMTYEDVAHGIVWPDVNPVGVVGETKKNFLRK